MAWVANWRDSLVWLALEAEGHTFTMTKVLELWPSESCKILVSLDSL